MSKIKTYTIDWHIHGSLEIDATSADEAQEMFDKTFSYTVHPLSDSEVENDPPYEEEL